MLTQAYIEKILDYAEVFFDKSEQRLQEVAAAHD